MNKYKIKKEFSGINGFQYCGTWDGFYHFSKPYKGGYYHIKCKHKDLLNKNIIDMLKLEVTL